MRYLLFCFSILLLNACSPDEVTFTTPSTYTYSHTKVNTQKVFEVKNKVVTETTQHPFDSTLKLLKDSTEQIMKLMFETGQVLSLEFVNDKEVKVIGTEDKNPFEREGSYLINDSKITFDGNDILINFSEDFKELYICIEASIHKGILSNGQSFNYSSFDFCNTKDHKISAQNFVSKSQVSTYEHIAITYLDMVYKMK